MFCACLIHCLNCRQRWSRLGQRQVILRSKFLACLTLSPSLSPMLLLLAGLMQPLLPDLLTFSTPYCDRFCPRMQPPISISLRCWFLGRSGYRNPCSGVAMASRAERVVLSYQKGEQKRKVAGNFLKSLVIFSGAFFAPLSPFFHFSSPCARIFRLPGSCCFASAHHKLSHIACDTFQKLFISSSREISKLIQSLLLFCFSSLENLFLKVLCRHPPLAAVQAHALPLRHLAAQKQRERNREVYLLLQTSPGHRRNT